MPRKREFCVGSALLLAAVSVQLLIAARPAHGQTEKVLYSFGGYLGDGSYPVAGLVFDTNGNLYGTTLTGGEYSVGTVFEITSDDAEKVLYSFGGYPGDGYYPEAALVFDTDDNLYSTTDQGGAYAKGTVFEITPAGTEKVLHSFEGAPGDGYGTYAGLVFDTQGNLYGTTELGGENGYFGEGTVFEIAPDGTEKVLYSFGSQSGDGLYPDAGLVFDTQGNLYGTTDQGGLYSYGTVFELTSTGAEKVLHSFPTQSKDGYCGCAGLAFDTQGNLYGTTYRGGKYYSGTVFEITGKHGKEKVLHTFGRRSRDGVYPAAALVVDNEGNLYGTTQQGGKYGYGTVFEITAAGKNGRKKKILYAFGAQSGDGQYPAAGLVFDTKGNLYGTTYRGGDLACGEGYGCGTVFEVTP